MPAATGNPAARAASARRAALVLDRWMAGRDYAGYDPHDLLNSPLVRRLAFGSRWLAIAWTQLGRRCPIAIRPVLGVPRVRNAKGIGLVLAAHVRLYRATGEDRFRRTAAGFVDWLEANASDGEGGAGWGYPFPWANRAFFAPVGTPSSVVTSFVGHALLDAAEDLGIDRARALAERAGTFLLRGPNRIPGPDGTFCFSYTPVDRRAVHNANVLAASLLARVAAATGSEDMRRTALASARFTAAAQRTDGGWPYGVAARDRWIDSFHTSYTLVALARVRTALGTDEFDDAIDRGLAFWRRSFLRGPGVRFSARAAYPIDLHAVAHTILALLVFRRDIPNARDRADRLAHWSIREMRDPGGYFYYQKHRLYRNKRRYMRWTQAWMLRALAALGVEEAPARR